MKNRTLSNIIECKCAFPKCIFHFWFFEVTFYPYFFYLMFSSKWPLPKLICSYNHLFCSVFFWISLFNVCFVLWKLKMIKESLNRKKLSPHYYLINVFLHSLELSFFSFLSSTVWRYRPEREGVVSDKRLTLPNQEGAVLGPALAVLLQELLSHLPTIATSTQLPVEPALRTVLLVVVALLTDRRRERGRDRKTASSLPDWYVLFPYF